MQKTKFQNIIFTAMMAFIMVYAMICYNIAINKSGMTNEVFLLAFHELIFMFPIAFILEFFLIEKLALFIAFKIVNRGDRPYFITFTISSVIVCLMCPIMSLIATLLFKNPKGEIIAYWLETTVLNFPMAYFLQIVIAGPLVRFLYSIIFPKKEIRA